MVVGDVGQFLAMELGDHQLFDYREHTRLRDRMREEVDTDCVATAQGVDVQERERLVTLIELEAGNLSCEAAVSIDPTTLCFSHVMEVL